MVGYWVSRVSRVRVRIRVRFSFSCAKMHDPTILTLRGAFKKFVA